MLIEVGDDEDAGSPSTSIAAACLKKETLSSLGDYLSLDKTPCGEVLHPLPVSK